MRFRVVKDWEAAYLDPIQLEKGDPIQITGRQDDWDGYIWLWAVSTSGRQGWIPDTLIVEGRNGPVAAKDYSAVELTCRTGQVLAGERETHGWVLCRSTDGSTGWVPRRNLIPDVP